MTQTPQLSATAPSPLGELHQRMGAVMGDLGGLSLPLHYGSVEGEHQALRRSCGLLDRWWVGRLVVTGEDRRRFLNGLVTCDVASLEAGKGSYGFFTSGQGRILADAVILALEDQFWLELPPGTAGDMAAHITKYRIMDRVEVTLLEDWFPMTLIGPGAGERLASFGALPEDDWEHLEGEVLGIGVRVVRQGLLGAPAYTLWVSPEEAPALAEGLLEAGRDSGLVPVGYQALEVLRVESGIPRFGQDFGPDNLPQETGLDFALSFTKGCYLGQEVVARIHYRGHVNRRLCGLFFPGEKPPEEGIRLFLEDREVGGVTSAVTSLALGRPIGLGMIHRRGAEPGTRLRLEGGGDAQVTELSFEVPGNSSPA